MAKSDKYYHSKEHKEWRKALLERDEGCIVCGSTERLNAHHLIPKNFKKFRSDINNGVLLCASHHCSYGYKISPHSHGSMLFFIWLMDNRPDLIEWVRENWGGMYDL